MRQISDAHHLKNPLDSSERLDNVISHQKSLPRITGLIQLCLGVLNGLIGLRFLLKLMGAEPTNAITYTVYHITSPFLWMFRGLTDTPTYQGVEVEYYSLIAILVYSMFGWVLVQLAWVLFAQRK